MAVAASDIVTRLSVVAAAGDTTASAPATSLGDQVSTTVWADGGTLFDTISGDENAASTVDYRCIFLLNNHASQTALGVKVYLSAEVAGGASVALAIDNIAASAKGSGSAQAATIATETTAPTGVGAFSSPTTAATGLVVGDLTAGQVRAVWIRRTAANSAAIDADGFTLGFAFDTAA